MATSTKGLQNNASNLIHDLCWQRWVRATFCWPSLSKDIWCHILRLLMLKITQSLVGWHPNNQLKWNSDKMLLLQCQTTSPPAWSDVETAMATYLGHIRVYVQLHICVGIGNQNLWAPASISKGPTAFTSCPIEVAAICDMDDMPCPLWLDDDTQRDVSAWWIYRVDLSINSCKTIGLH